MTPFDAACRILGHGEPENAAWFVGLEYADAYTAPSEALDHYCKHGEITRPTEQPNFAPLGNAGNAIRHLTSRILRHVSSVGAEHEHHGWYLDNMLWCPGSETFQANVLPLGRPRHDTPIRELYVAQQWGMGEWDEPTYEREAAFRRFPLLRKHWRNSAQKAAVCFGIRRWDLFRELFQVTSQAVELVPGKIVYHLSERVILTPFFRFEQVSYEDADRIGSLLRDTFNVRIP